jgi:hypothetical protein
MDNIQKVNYSRHTSKLKKYQHQLHNVNISVGIPTGYGLDDRGSITRRGKRFSLLHSVQTGSEAYPASYPVGTEGSSPGVKRPGREIDHSFPSSAEVINGGAIPPLPVRLHGIVLN